jgi:hypothetical protein
VDDRHSPTVMQYNMIQYNAIQYNKIGSMASSRTEYNH